MDKLWRWEEKSYQQEKKRNILWIVAIICWLVALYVTYWVEHTLYGKIVDTGTFTYLGVSIGMPIGCWFRKISGKEDRPLTKKRKWVERIVLTISLAVIAWGVFHFGMVIQGVQAACILPFLLWLERKGKLDVDKISLGACELFVIAVLMIVGTFAGPKVMGLTSIKQAEKTIAERGFSQVEYLGSLRGRWAYQDAVDKSFYTADMSEKWFYMLYGEENAEPYRFLVDPKGGEIILAASEKEEPELSNWSWR